MNLDLRFIAKLAISLAIIVFCSQIGRKLPSLAGLIATAPLTGLIVLLWLYSDNPGNMTLMTDYTKAALLGIVPSILFFIAAYICFKKSLAIWVVLAVGFAFWLIAAAIHQWLLSK